MKGQGVLPADGKWLPLNGREDFGTSASAAWKRVYLSRDVDNAPPTSPESGQDGSPGAWKAAARPTSRAPCVAGLMTLRTI
jgi:hypothetical protein